MADNTKRDRLIWDLLHDWEAAAEDGFAERWSPEERPEFDQVIAKQRARVAEVIGLPPMPANTKRDSIWDYDGDGDVDKDDANAWLVLLLKALAPLTIVLLLGVIICLSTHPSCPSQ